MLISYIGKSLRINKGYTVRGLAGAAGVACSSISKWENGMHLPDLYSLGLIAMVLNCKPCDLIDFNLEDNNGNCT